MHFVYAFLSGPVTPVPTSRRVRGSRPSAHYAWGGPLVSPLPRQLQEEFHSWSAAFSAVDVFHELKRDSLPIIADMNIFTN